MLNPRKLGEKTDNYGKVCNFTENGKSSREPPQLLMVLSTN